MKTKHAVIVAFGILIKFMAGLHVRYKIVTVGYDFLNGRAYIGVVLCF